MTVRNGSSKSGGSTRAGSTRAGAARATRASKTKPRSKARKASSTNDARVAKKPRKAASEAADSSAVWTLRLYVTGRGERSERALKNLRSLCESNLTKGSYQIEVIDLMKNPELAKADQILAIPTLVRKLPEPMKRIIGDLSNADRALLSLDFPKSP